MGGNRREVYKDDVQETNWKNWVEDTMFSNNHNKCISKDTQEMNVITNYEHNPQFHSCLYYVVPMNPITVWWYYSSVTCSIPIPRPNSNKHETLLFDILLHTTSILSISL